MTQDGVVIVGGGLAGQSCAQTLRRKGYDGVIRMVCAEPVVPYDRPPLSKSFLTGKLDDREVSLKPGRWYRDHEIELILGRSAIELRPDVKKVQMSGGTVLGYDRLLIASGSKALTLAFLDGFENAHSLRTLADARRLRADLGTGGRVAIIGSGFIGQEVAASAHALGDEVTLIEAAAAPLAPVLGVEVGRWLGRRHSDRGVTLLTGATVEAARGNGTARELRMADGRRVACDAVVVGIGARPATDWLAGSGLDPARVIIDPSGQTQIPDVYAAGDVATSFDPRAGAWTRSEHWDSAVRQGRAAALGMLGQPSLPPVLPSFWSDQYGQRIQYIGYAGLADRIEIETDPERHAIEAGYWRGDDLVATLAVDRSRQIARARTVIDQNLQVVPRRKVKHDVQSGSGCECV